MISPVGPAMGDGHGDFHGVPSFRITVSEPVHVFAAADFFECLFEFTLYAGRQQDGGVLADHLFRRSRRCVRRLLFQLVMMPLSVLLMMASSEDSPRRQDGRRLFHAAMFAAGLAVCSSLRAMLRRAGRCFLTM